MRVRLSAHQYDEDVNGFVSTLLFQTKATAIIEAASTAEIESAIASFGPLHAPCNVWASAVSAPKARGFDKWNRSNGAARWLFPATVTTGAGAS